MRITSKYKEIYQSTFEEIKVHTELKYVELIFKADGSSRIINFNGACFNLDDGDTFSIVINSDKITIDGEDSR